VSRHGDAAVPHAMFVSVPHLPAVPQSEPQRRLSESGSLSNSLREAAIAASYSKLSLVDTQAADTAQPQTLAECQEFIRQLSVRQVQAVVILAM